MEEDFHRYKLVKEIDAGGMSETFIARRKTDNKKYFLKRVRLNTQDEVAMRRELNIYDKLLRWNLQHVAGFVEHVLEPPFLAIVAELANRGDLHSYVTQHNHGRGLPRDQVLPIAKTIALAIAVLHKNDFVHRDLKPLGILRFPDGWKVTDLGISKNLIRFVTNHTMQGRGSKGRAPPKQWIGLPATTSTDIYSFEKILVFWLVGATDIDF